METDTEVNNIIDNRFNEILNDIYDKDDICEMPSTIDEAVGLIDNKEQNYATNDSI